MDRVFIFHITLIVIFVLAFVVMWKFFSMPPESMFLFAYSILMFLLVTDAKFRREKPS